MEHVYKNERTEKGEKVSNQCGRLKNGWYPRRKMDSQGKRKTDGTL